MINKADDEWEWYLGKLFLNIIKESKLENINTVVELAPGFKYKIAYALKDINFNGNLYVIDEDKDVLSFILIKYKEILPNANIIAINLNFKEAIDLLPNKIDLFLSNHCIDDMIIFKYMNICKYDGNYSKEDIFLYWKKLLNDNYTDEIINDIKNSFNKLFFKKDIRKVIISQYKSNVFLNDINELIYDIIFDCFSKVKALINTNDEFINNALNFYPFGIEDKRYNYLELLDNMQNAKHWIVGECYE